VPREAPPTISGMRGFITQVEFADGGIWIPTRQGLGQNDLLRLLPVSPEEQRLSELYRTKGVPYVWLVDPVDRRGQDG
jgi:hypothetical protein